MTSLRSLYRRVAVLGSGSPLLPGFFPFSTAWTWGFMTRSLLCRAAAFLDDDELPPPYSVKLRCSLRHQSHSSTGTDDSV